MKRIITLLVAVLALAVAMPTEAQTRRKSTARKTTAVKRSTTTKAAAAANPFKGKWSGKNEAIELNLYAKTVNSAMDGKCYGVIEGVYMNGNRIDEHIITEVLSIEGNTAKVKSTCGYSGEEIISTITYNPANRSITVKNPDETPMCFQNGTATFRKK